MKLSEQLTAWIDAHNALDDEMTALQKEIWPLQKKADPFTYLENTRGLAAGHSEYGGTLAAWDRLKAVWDSCGGSSAEKFAAVYMEIGRQTVPYFIKQRIDKSYKAAADFDTLGKILVQGKDLERRAAAFVKHSAEVSDALTAESQGNMVFKLEHREVTSITPPFFGYPTNNFVNYRATISDFPGQKLFDIAQRFLAAAHADGYTHFKLLGMTPHAESLNSVYSDTYTPTDNPPDQFDVDPTQALSVRFILADSNKPPERWYPGLKVILFELIQRENESVLMGIHMLQLDPNNTPGSEYGRRIGGMLDHVAESYRE